MPDRNDPNKDKNMGLGNREQQPGQGQRTPGRDFEEDDLSTGKRQGGGHGFNQGQGGASNFDREDREREQPGSTQKDQNR